MTTIVYDIEIAKAIPDRRAPPEQGIAYCEGWHDHAGMGIGVLCAYDYEQDRVRVFCKDNAREFGALVASAKHVVGFNNTRFDNKVLKAAWGIDVPDASNYDIMQEVMNSIGTASFAGLSLNAICSANGLAGKTGSGARAPIDWQQGNFGTVADYCIHDVLLTRQLLDRIRQTGQLMCPKTATMLKIRPPPFL